MVASLSKLACTETRLVQLEINPVFVKKKGAVVVDAFVLREVTMTNWMWILIAYLAGSFPTGYVFVKLFCGEDIRTFGSGNIGATNVGRRMGKKWAIIVTIIDMIKGGMVLVLARSMKVEGSSLLALMAFASVSGHNFPYG